MKRITVILLAAIFSAALLSICRAQDSQNTSDSAEPQSEESDAEFRRSLLEDDLTVNSAVVAAAPSQVKSTDTTKDQKSANATKVAGGLYSRGNEEKDRNAAHTGVENKNIVANTSPWRGQPLYQGTAGSTQSTGSLIVSNTLTNMNVTVIRPQSRY